MADVTAPAGGALRPRRRPSPRTLREYLIFLAFVAPNLLLIGAFTYRPLIANIQYSTLNWTLGSPSATVVGLENYVRFFSGPDARVVLGTTAIFTVFTVGGSMVLGLLISLALNRGLRGTTFARSAVFAPYVLSGVGVGLVWLFIFDPVYGLISFLLRGL
ncbi:MAG: sugar ABC transporter permease, partial [Propionibacteriales bacterium]|nr:sugar ABC transporter permease [Propionibacteriales bacterium]